MLDFLDFDVVCIFRCNRGEGVVENQQTFVWIADVRHRMHALLMS